MDSPNPQVTYRLAGFGRWSYLGALVDYR